MRRTQKIQRQLTLLGEGFSLPEPRFEQVAPAALSVQHGLPPDAGFVQSVARFGVIEPVLLLACAGDRQLVNGRRRVCAARMLGLEQVPALVYAFGEDWRGKLEWIASTLALTLNELRRDNPLADLHAIAALRAKGASDQDIRQVTGMPASRIRRREALTQLHAGLLEALGDGRIGARLAEQCARLPAPLQEELHNRYEQCGQLSCRDLAQVREARLQAAQRALTGLDALLRAPVADATLAEIAGALTLATARRVASELPCEPCFEHARQLFARAGEATAIPLAAPVSQRDLIPA